MPGVCFVLGFLWGVPPRPLFSGCSGITASLSLQQWTLAWTRVLKRSQCSGWTGGPLLLYKSVEQSPRCPPVHLCMRAGWYVRAAIVLSLFQYVLALSFCLDCFQDSKPMPDMSGPTHRHEGSVDCSRTSGPRLSIPSIAKSFFQLQTASLQHQQPSRYLLPTPAVLAELPLSFLSGAHCSGLPQAQAELIVCSAPVNHS